MEPWELEEAVAVAVEAEEGMTVDAVEVEVTY